MVEGHRQGWCPYMKRKVPMIFHTFGTKERPPEPRRGEGYQKLPLPQLGPGLLPFHVFKEGQSVPAAFVFVLVIICDGCLSRQDRSFPWRKFQ